MQFCLAISGLKDGLVKEVLASRLGASGENLDCNGLQWGDLMQEMISETISQQQTPAQLTPEQSTSE